MTDTAADIMPPSPRTNRYNICENVLNDSKLDLAIKDESLPNSSNRSRTLRRYVFIVMGFLGFFNLYAMRVNLSVALVAMVKDPLVSDDIASAQSSVACLDLIKDIKSHNSTVHFISPASRGGFDWDSQTQHLVLGSFYYGYFLTQIPGGIMAEKYSAKALYGMGILVTAIFTLLTPLAANWSVWALVAARTIEGLGEGVTYPAMNVLVGRWAGEMERTSTLTMISIGTTIGTVVSLIVSGQLCDSTFLGGWPSAFYVFGILGVVTFILWTVLVSESPEMGPRILKTELTGLQTNQKESGIKNGVLSALPNLIQLIVALAVSFIVDKLRSTGRMQITFLRKIVNSIGSYAPAICMIAIAFSGCHPIIIVILFSIAMGSYGCIYSGFNATHIDMSPEFAGTLMGITNCIANLPGFLAPAFVGFIIHSGNTLQNWGIVYVTTAVILIISGTIYNILCKADLQPWSPSYEPQMNTEVMKDTDEKELSST
nr:putative inorganic phosphate cotransporter isoform X2 [Parasteatoda tepidariorum]